MFDPTPLEGILNILVLLPIICLNGTLSLVETLQRLVSFREKRIVGTVSGLFIVPVRGTKLAPVPEWPVSVSGFLLNKRIAVYKTEPVVTRVPTNSGSCKLLEVTSEWTDRGELLLTHPDAPLLSISLSDITCGERVYGIKFRATENDGREYLKVGNTADSWLSGILGYSATMLYVPDTTLGGDSNYPVYGNPTSPHLGCVPAAVPPVHITACSTLRALNEAAGSNIEMERFRPNIVVDGSTPGEEALWSVIRIGATLELEQSFANPRCGTVNALGSTFTPGVYDTLRKYGPFRDTQNRPCFGSYWRVLRRGRVTEGDTVTVLRSLKREISGEKFLPNEIVVGI